MVELLRQRPRRAGEIAAAVGLSPAALTRHLRALKQGGLIVEALPISSQGQGVHAQARADGSAEGLARRRRAAVDRGTRRLQGACRALGPVTSKTIVALRVKATSGRAFDVFVREIGLWRRPNDLFRFTAGPPGPLTFEPWLDGRLIGSTRRATPSKSAASPDGRPASGSSSPGGKRISPPIR